ncbi:MAG: polysaccharide pyruvyl transferase family protein, partial [Candidatus Paceibacterota bacterium]
MVESSVDIVKLKYPNANIYFLSKDKPSKYILNKYNAKKILLYGSIDIGDLTLRFLKRKVFEGLFNLGGPDVEDIDLILDVNGYYIADKWSVKHSLRQLDLYKRFKKNDTRIIMMPKSFGPFNQKEKLGIFSHLLSLCDVVYARDELSFENLNKLSLSKDILFLSSDYTSISKPEVDSEVLKYKDYAVIIINNRMVDGSKYSVSEYNSYIDKLISILKEMKIDPVFVMHDIKRDIIYYKNYLEKEYPKIPVFYTENPLKLKGISSVSKIVFSSRYHGILNALNTYRPVIGTSWAHKYKYIAKEYGIEKYIVSPNIDISLLRNKVNEALKGKQNHLINKDSVILKRNDICVNISEKL